MVIDVCAAYMIRPHLEDLRGGTTRKVGQAAVEMIEANGPVGCHARHELIGGHVGRPPSIRGAPVGLEEVRHPVAKIQHLVVQETVLEEEIEVQCEEISL